MPVGVESNITPEALVHQVRDLPSEPRVLRTLEELLARDNTTLDRIADLIRLEPALTARTVRMASSVYFGQGARVDTLTEAIQRVGLDGVRKLVTFAVASELVGHPLAAYRLTAPIVWHRAIACALAAGSLAEHSGAADAHDAYTAGFLHGLGLVVIDRHATRSGRTAAIESSGYPLDFAPAEREWLGFSHAEAGATLLERWGFPPAVTTAVRHQLAPEEAPSHRQLCAILATARWARSFLCVPEELIPELPSPGWLQTAGIDVRDFGAWLTTVRRGFERACRKL